MCKVKMCYNIIMATFWFHFALRQSMEKTQINKFLTWWDNSKTTVTSIKSGMWSKISVSLTIMALLMVPILSHKSQVITSLQLCCYLGLLIKYSIVKFHRKCSVKMFCNWITQKRNFVFIESFFLHSFSYHDDWINY